MYGDPGRAEEALERTLRTPRMRRLGALGGDLGELLLALGLLERHVRLDCDLLERRLRLQPHMRRLELARLLARLLGDREDVLLAARLLHAHVGRELGALLLCVRYAV